MCSVKEKRPKFIKQFVRHFSSVVLFSDQNDRFLLPIICEPETHSSISTRQTMNCAPELRISSCSEQQVDQVKIQHMVYIHTNGVVFPRILFLPPLFKAAISASLFLWSLSWIKTTPQIPLTLCLQLGYCVLVNDFQRINTALWVFSTVQNFPGSILILTFIKTPWSLHHV